MINGFTVGRESLNLIIDCFQSESTVDNPISVIHVRDIINDMLIVEAQKSSC